MKNSINIDNFEANKPRNKIIKHQATTEDELKLKKYFFEKNLLIMIILIMIVFII